MRWGGALRRLVGGGRVRHGDGETSGLINPAAWLTHVAGGGTPSGETVTPLSAMRLQAVFSCVQALSEDLAKMPLILYRRRGRGKERATDHPAYHLLHTRPNDLQTAYEYIRNQTWTMLMHGNCYAAKQRDARQRVQALVPVSPLVTVQRAFRQGFETALFYDLRPNPTGGMITLPGSEVVHLKEYSLDGLVGVSRVTWQREVLGNALAMQTHGSTFFGNSALPGAVLEHPGALSAEAAARLRNDWRELHRGAAKAHEVAVLYEGMTFKPITVSNKDAQWLEARKMSRSEIAAIYRVPLHMIGDLERATFSNIEHQSMMYIRDALLSLARCWEQCLNNALLFDNERDEFFFEFLFDGLLRADSTQRAQSYSTYLQNGVMSINEVRERENMNPIDGGDAHRVQVNTSPVAGNDDRPGDQGGSDGPPDEPAPEGSESDAA